MKFLYELLPVTLFFIFYKIYDIYIATAVLMVATYIQILITYIIKKKIEKILAFTGVVITIFGGMTLIFQNNAFIMWKPSIIYWAFALAILVAEKIYNKNLIKLSLSSQVQIEDRYWKNLSGATAIFFTFLGVLNIYIAQNFSEDTWVNFKLFGTSSLLFIYIILITLYISKVNKD